MTTHLPPTLYRFMDVKDNPRIPGFNRCRELLQSERLYLSNPGWFNDPFDPLPSFEKVADAMLPEMPKRDFYFLSAFDPKGWGNVSLPHFLSTIPEQKEKKWPKVRTEWLDRYRELCSTAIRVVCLSERCDNNLMWSHYADCHRGIAVGFDCTKPPFPEMAHVIGKVRYESRRPAASPDGWTRIDDFHVKSPDWHYEREWRIVLNPKSAGIRRDDSKGEFIEVPISAVSAIYLGWMFDPKGNEQLVSILADSVVRNPGIKLYQMVPHPEEYDLIPKPVDLHSMIKRVSGEC